MLWVVAANSNHCRIYKYDKNQAKLDLLNEINHPEIKQKTSDSITTDKPGHYQTNESARGAYSPHMDAKEVLVDRFSKEIADTLDKGRKDSSYEQLIIITPPHMNGLLLKHLDKNAKNLVINNIQKNIDNLVEHDLIEFLKSHAKYPDPLNE